MREWPDQFFDIDRDAWANDPLGQWGGVPSYTLNYAFMNLFDVIPCGAEAGGEPRYEVKNDNDMTARKRNFYAALSYIHTYPPYEPYDDMESRIGVSSFTFSRQVLPALYNMSAHAYFMDMNLRFWDYNHTADFQERVLWSVDGYPMEVCASSNRFVRKRLSRTQSIHTARPPKRQGDTLTLRRRPCSDTNLVPVLTQTSTFNLSPSSPVLTICSDNFKRNAAGAAPSGSANSRNRLREQRQGRDHGASRQQTRPCDGLRRRLEPRDRAEEAARQQPRRSAAAQFAMCGPGGPVSLAQKEF